MHQGHEWPAVVWGLLARLYLYWSKERHARPLAGKARPWRPRELLDIPTRVHQNLGFLARLGRRRRVSRQGRTAKQKLSLKIFSHSLFQAKIPLDAWAPECKVDSFRRSMAGDRQWIAEPQGPATLKIEEFQNVRSARVCLRRGLDCRVRDDPAHRTRCRNKGRPCERHEPNAPLPQIQRLMIQFQEASPAAMRCPLKTGSK